MFNLQEVLGFINDNEYLAYDTETTGLNVRKDIVIGFGISNATIGHYIPLVQYAVSDGALIRTHVSSNDITTILTALQSKKLLMFNASYDARITLNNLGVDLLPALHTDVLLLKHSCDEEFPFGLKEIATKLWGHNVKEEKEQMLASIKTNGGSSKEFYKADVGLLAKYCIQDCLLTFRLFNHYSKELKRQGLEAFYYQDEVLPLYKEVTVPMENAGVRLDIALLTKTLAEITLDLTTLERTIKAEITPQLGLFNEWFHNKEYPFKATGRVGKSMKQSGASLGAVQQALATEDFPEGAFNLSSKHHLKKLFFDTMKCIPLSTTPTGLPQVDEEFLETIKDLHIWVKDLITYNKLNKLKGTYIENLLNDSENGRYYPSFMQHRTVSGRYAGNLQQLPRPVSKDGSLIARYTNRIREFILSDEDSVLVSADYEQLEPSIFAHTCGDPELQKIFHEGKDFYSTVAIATENLIGVSADKSSSNYLGLCDKSRRQRAKSYALGLAYGMTSYKLKFEIEVSEDEATILVENYFKAFPKLAQWMQFSKDTVKRTGVISTQSGRIRHMPRASALFTKYGPVIDDDLRLWKAFHSNPEKYAFAKLERKEYKNLLNNACNFQIQGLAASIMNRASINVARELKQLNLRSKIVMSVHDEIVLNVPKEEEAIASEIVKRHMETVVLLTVPLRTTPQSGTNFRQCK